MIEVGDYVTISDQEGVFLVTGVYANGISGINVDGGTEGGWVEAAVTKVMSESLIEECAKAVNETIATKAKKWAYSDEAQRKIAIKTMTETLLKAKARMLEQEYGDGSRWEEL